MRVWATLIASGVLGTAAVLNASEVDEAVSAAFRAYLGGRYEEAASSYRYLDTLGVTDPAHSANQALMLRDMGRPDEAAAHWMRATVLGPRDAFLWNQRGWNYLALGETRDAREMFRKSVEVSTTAESAAEANLGLGLSESLGGNSKAAYAPLQAVVSRSPYLVSAAAAELGRITARMQHYPQSIPFLTMSLGQDPLQVDTVRDLAGLYDKTGQSKGAWQAYKLVLDQDPGDEEARRKEEGLARYIEGRPEDSIPLRRLSRPLVQAPSGENGEGDGSAPAPAAPSAEKDPKLRVLLYTDPQGNPAHLRRFFFIASSEFRVNDPLTGEVNRDKPLLQWEVFFRPDNRVIEVRNNLNEIVLVTKQPFRIERTRPWGTILIKSAEFTDIKGVDIGDRELRDTVEVVPTPMGFHLVNELPVEEYLPSVIGAALPPESPLEAYKAMAVFARSRTSALIAGGKGFAGTHLCDSTRCVPYQGITAESAVASMAVRKTKGVSVLVPGLSLEYHPSCGWSNAAFVQDRPVPALPPKSPLDFERLTHGFPDPKSFDDASARVPASWNRWARVFDAAFLRSNIERTTPVGPLQAVAVLRRDPTGRVSALEVVGARGRATLEGEKAIADFLSPGSLRSTLFTLLPIYRGRTIEKLLVWGAGTGHGRGLCVAGAVGQAQMGRGYQAILAHYFPGLRFIGAPNLPQPAPLVEASAQPPRKKNPASKLRPAPARLQPAGTSSGWSPAPRRKRHKKK